MLLICSTTSIYGDWDFDNPQKLVPINFLGNPEFGRLLAYSPDGEHLAIGGFRDDSYKGAVWVYQKNATNQWDWDDPKKLVPTNPIGSDIFFGYSLAYSSDSKYLAIGGYMDDAVWVYQKNATDRWDWDNPKKLVPTNPIGSAYFGYKLDYSFDSKNLVIGGHRDDFYKGAAWVYQKNTTDQWDWDNPEKIVLTNPNGNPYFGRSLAYSLDNKYLAICGAGDDSGYGAAWVYQKNATGQWDWNNPEKLIPTNPLGFPNFGDTLVFSPDSQNLVISGPFDDFGEGAVWVYQKNATDQWNWDNPEKLIPTNPLGSETWFGNPLSYSPDSKHLAIGGYKDNSDNGAVWVYQKNATGQWDWNSPQKVVSTGSMGDSSFGYVLVYSFDSENLVVGGTWDDSYKGAAWVYQKNATDQWDWDNPEKLVPTNLLGNSFFGYRLSYSPGSKHLAIGGYGDDSQKGAVWVYNCNNCTMPEATTILPGTPGITASIIGSTTTNSITTNSIATTQPEDTTATTQPEDTTGDTSSALSLYNPFILLKFLGL